MYPVSEAFLQAVQENTRRFFWTGRITTKAGAVHVFGNEDIVKGSGYISGQCCGSTEIEIGKVYAAEMGLTLFSEIDRYTLEDAKIELFYHLRLGSGSFEEVPMGIFEVSEANRTLHCLEIKAYDYMLRFERSFNGFETVGNGETREELQEAMKELTDLDNPNSVAQMKQWLSDQGTEVESLGKKDVAKLIDEVPDEQREAVSYTHLTLPTTSRV